MLATDLSARCDRALERSILLAEQLQGEVIVAHVVEVGRMEDSEAYGELVMEYVQDQFGSTEIAVETLILHGSAPYALASAAVERDCDIIVTGVARYNSLRDHILGTAVDYLVRHTPIPVLIVKNRWYGQGYEKLLVAVDLSPCSRHALVHSAEIFQNAKIDVVYAYHVPYDAMLSSKQVADDVREEAEEALEAFLGNPSLPSSIRSRLSARAVSGELATVVDRRLASGRPDLVVLGTHGKSGFVHATLGSRAAELLSWLPSDVLMIRDRD
jgi:nucleotide-binding universal stress UspA family protein